MSRNATSDRTASGTLLSGYAANGFAFFNPSIGVHRSPATVERTLAVEQIMRSLERITDWAFALARSLSTLFAALDPIPIRERLRIPRPVLGGWQRYPGFAEPPGRGIGRPRRARDSWRAMVANSDGTVSLRGIADSTSARLSAMTLANNTRGVQSVDSTHFSAN